MDSQKQSRFRSCFERFRGYSEDRDLLVLRALQHPHVEAHGLMLPLLSFHVAAPFVSFEAPVHRLLNLVPAGLHEPQSQPQVQTRARSAHLERARRVLTFP